MPYFIFLITILFSFLSHAEEVSIEQKIIKLDKKIGSVDSRILQIEKHKITINNELVKLTQNEDKTRVELTKNINKINSAYINILRMERAPVEAMVFLDSLRGVHARRIITRKVKESINTEIKIGRDNLNALLESQRRKELALNELEQILANQETEKKHLTYLLADQVKLLNLSEENRKKLTKQMEDFAKSKTLNSLLAGYNKTITPMPKTRALYGKLPVKGKIIIDYNEVDKLGIHASGITILASPVATVNNIIAGRVIYSGKFRKYGHLVILEHGEGLHTIYGGIPASTAKVGDFIQAGSALGVLSNMAEPKLYFELRRHGKAIDPSKWLI